MALLTGVAATAAMAHAPFVAAAAPRMFGFERFTQLSAPRDLASIFARPEYAAWNRFRDAEDSHYVALTFPRVLARLPWGAGGQQAAEFDFQELADGADHDRHLWMSAAWAYAVVVARAFANYGWLARTHGVEGGGRVENLPVNCLRTAEGDVAMKCPTEVYFEDRRELELSNLGFLPLLPIRGRDFAAFLGARSCHRARLSPDAVVADGGVSSVTLRYRLCAARFAQFLAVRERDNMAFSYREDIEQFHNDWLQGYVLAAFEGADQELRARKPLCEGRVVIQGVKGKPGRFEAVMDLRPAFQLPPPPTPIRLIVEIPRRC
jgi:type VI secretion system protein ImpC